MKGTTTNTQYRTRTNSGFLPLKLLVLLPFVLMANLVHGQVAAFTPDKLTGCAPVIVNFQNNSTGADSYVWDFGNGTATSIVTNPGTTYLNAGTYTVKLIAKNTATGTTDETTQVITILASPVVDFKTSTTDGCFPLTTTFTDLTTTQNANITSWTWDFGDGTVVTGPQNPTHTYTLTGKFSVLLKVTQDNGCGGNWTKSDYITVAQGVKADFFSDPPVGCKPPASIQFHNRSTGPGTLTYAWTFGNGQPGSTQQDPTSTYNSPGNYTAKLVATSSFGCSDSISRPVTIPSTSVNASFTAPDTACLGRTISFNNTSAPDPDSSFWFFGDGTTSKQLSPTKSYATQGDFPVKLIAYFGSCVDSFSKTVVIPTAPAINFTSTNPLSCKSPFTVDFKDNTPGAVAWNWQFSNGFNSTQQNPTAVAFNSDGTYSIRLGVTDKYGCTYTKDFVDYVKVAKPTMNILFLPDSGCAPLTIHPTATPFTYDGVKSITWDFGNGTTANTATPTAVYASPGIYTVIITMVTNTGCTIRAPYVGGVKVGDKSLYSEPDFTATPLINCAGQPIQFKDLTPFSPAITGWNWDFGDGTIGNEKDPVHSYSDTGTFTVKLKIFNNGCGKEAIKTDLIKIAGSVAFFNYKVDCGNKRLVTFNDSSLNAATWAWDFGDGTTFNGSAPPPHLFPALGRYTVKLTVTNGSCSFTTAKIIRVIDEKADYLINPNPLCRGVSSTFTAVNVVDSNIVKYEWDLGSGIYQPGTATTTLNLPVPGSYTTRLRITDINGCVDSTNKPLSVGGPKADFTALSPTGCKGITVNFADSSKSDGVNAIVTRIWDFGDGSGPLAINTGPFQHTYSGTGSYSVKLKVIDAGGCSDSLLLPSFVTTSDPKALFNTVDTMTCPGGRAVQFDNTTGGTINNFVWDFGDGTTSNQRSPLHVYNTVGDFGVELKIRDRFGCEDSLFLPKLVLVDTPHASFTMSNSIGNCPPLRVNFTYTGHYDQSLRWDFGDGNVSDLKNPEHFFTRARTFIPQLTVTSPGGCTAVANDTIVIFGPDGNITFTPPGGCEPLSVDFAAANLKNVDYIAWDFGDGLIKNKDSVQTHIYTTQGIYYPIVSLVSDKLDCSVAIKLDSIKVIRIFPNFGADRTRFCSSGDVQFRDSSVSVGTFTNWSWDFGDGTTSTDQHPLHHYDRPGLYTVTLTTTTEFGCTNTFSRPGFIAVVAPPNISISSSLDSLCRNAPVTFQGIEVIKDTSALIWHWDMANGKIESGQNPPAQTYGVAGDFTVEAIATNSTGCQDTAQYIVHVQPLPPTDAGLDSTICLGQSVQLNAVGANTYQWQPPVTGLSCTDCANPVATPAVSTLYMVKGSTAFGCTFTDSVWVNVIQPSTVIAPPDDSVCYSQGVRLTATGTQLYSWSPATGLSNTNVSSPVARPLSTITYTVTGSDAKGCFVTTDTVHVTVFPIPLVNIGADTTISVGASLQIVALVSPDVRGIQWQPVGTLSCLDCLDPVARPSTSTTYQAIVTNDGGCTTTDEIRVTVICNNANIFMPNTFSPNGDGMNDVYYPRGHGVQAVKSLRIFNRWGQLMYERQNFNANDASAAWDGRFHGTALPPDVYVYIMEYVCENGVIVAQKGDITLVR